MDLAELTSVINELRSLNDDGQHVEAKRAGGGFPTENVARSVSAFSNATGGVVLLGVDQESGFAATGVANAKSLINSFANLGGKMQPPARPELTHIEFEGVDIVVGAISESASKPIYTPNGDAYIRVGDQDRRLQGFELQVLRERTGVPDHDCRAVPGTGMSDLDTDLLESFLRLVRLEGPPQLAGETDEGLLRRMRVLAESGEVTVAGLLALGSYPQQFLPQVNATFVHFAKSDGSELEGTRFIDSRDLDGSIGAVLSQSEVVLRQNMSRRHESTGMKVADRWEYPPIALREAIANALVHRDLSEFSRGSQVQIEMYPDRLEVRSPGGLHGTVTSENIGTGASSSRNSCLVRILSSVRFEDGKRIVENRGTGIKTMVSELFEASMSPPEFADDIATFTVRFPADSLLGTDFVEWIASLGQEDLTGTQVRGLAMMRGGSRIDNSSYRLAMGLDSQVAREELQDLVSRGLAIQIGSKRWTKYALRADATPTATRTTAGDRRRIVLEALGKEQMSREQIAGIIGRDKRTTNRWLSELREGGFVRQTGKSSSHNVLWEATGLTDGQLVFLDER